MEPPPTPTNFRTNQHTSAPASAGLQSPPLPSAGGWHPVQSDLHAPGYILRLLRDDRDLFGAKPRALGDHGVDAGEDFGPRLVERSAGQELWVIFDAELDALGD